MRRLDIFVKRVGQERMPVAHADMNGERDAAGAQPCLELAGLTQRELGQRRHAAEPVVVVGDFLDTFGRHATPAQDVGKKRPHVGRRLRSTEGNEQHRVERLRHGRSHRSLRIVRW